MADEPKVIVEVDKECLFCKRDIPQLQEELAGVKKLQEAQEDAVGGSLRRLRMGMTAFAVALALIVVISLVVVYIRLTETTGQRAAPVPSRLVQRLSQTEQRLGKLEGTIGLLKSAMERLAEQFGKVLSDITKMPKASQPPASQPVVTAPPLRTTPLVKTAKPSEREGLLPCKQEKESCVKGNEGRVGKERALQFCATFFRQGGPNCK